MTNKEYLHKLFIVKKNLEEFLKFIPDSDYEFYELTFSYISLLKCEIKRYRLKVTKEDEIYTSKLMTIFDFEE